MLRRLISLVAITACGGSDPIPRSPPSGTETIRGDGVIALVADRDRIYCAGVIVAEGRAITAEHCVDDVAIGSAVRVLVGSRSVSTRLLAREASRDLALLGSPVLHGSRGIVDPSIRDRVWVIGHPLGLRNVTTHGVVSGFADRSGTTMILTDAACWFGNSGGPMISPTTGDLVGIVTVLVYPGLCGAVHAREVREFLSSVPDLPDR